MMRLVKKFLWQQPSFLSWLTAATLLACLLYLVILAIGISKNPEALIGLLLLPWMVVVLLAEILADALSRRLWQHRPIVLWTVQVAMALPFFVPGC